MAALAQRVALLERQLTSAQARVALAHQRPDIAATAAISARLDTLLAVCSALLVTHEPAAVMRLVVQQAITLFPGASVALLYLYDTASNLVILRASSATEPPPMAVVPGEGISGHAFVAPRAMLMVGPELEMALDDLDAVRQGELARLLDTWPPASALLAPLRVESQRLGSLVIYSGVHAHLFIPRDLPFVQALADLAAVAIAETSARERTKRLEGDLIETQTRQAEIQARFDLAQAQLLQSAKLAAVGELAASVAHEINNPLYAARNSLYLVDQDLPADAPQRPFLEIAQSELGRIARIITRMRDFYRPTRSELELVNIGDILTSTVELVHTHLRHGHVDIQEELAPQLPMLEAHADQMRQVFLNLMLNACDAMPNGGTLRISTALDQLNGNTPAITVVIADTGIGIPPEHRPHLFEPFYTTKPQGTGLGLAISAHIIAQHGGQIQLTSEVGVGTTFTITLPLAAQHGDQSALD
jgi:two-component system NtrC family sensor kinase